MSTRSDQLEWRRSKVIEMRARVLSLGEIAGELQVSEASISSDIQYLRNEAKESIREYTTEHLPEQYQVCLIALDTIIKRAFDIIETSDDNREKLQAMELFKDTHLVKLELLSNATTIDSALNYIRNKQQKGLSLDSANKDDDQPETSGRFQYRAQSYAGSLQNVTGTRWWEVAINPDRFDKLITALRTAVDNDSVLDKESTSYNDIFDAFRLALKFYHFQERID